jgi:hypothetical protein
MKGQYSININAHTGFLKQNYLDEMSVCNKYCTIFNETKVCDDKRWPLQMKINHATLNNEMTVCNKY